MLLLIADNFMLQIINVSNKKCVDISLGYGATPILIFDCHGQGGHQVFNFAKNQMIFTNEELCFGVNEVNEVLLVHCLEEDSQFWIYQNEVVSLRKGNYYRQNFFSFVFLDEMASTCTKWTVHAGK